MNALALIIIWIGALYVMFVLTGMLWFIGFIAAWGIFVAAASI